jgi:hypothetical protein
MVVEIEPSSVFVITTCTGEENVEMGVRVRVVEVVRGAPVWDRIVVTVSLREVDSGRCEQMRRSRDQERDAKGRANQISQNRECGARKARRSVEAQSFITQRSTKRSRGFNATSTSKEVEERTRGKGES